MNALDKLRLWLYDEYFDWCSDDLNIEQFAYWLIDEKIEQKNKNIHIVLNTADSLFVLNNEQYDKYLSKGMHI